MGRDECYFQSELGCMTDDHYALLSNAFAGLEDMTDKEDLLLQNMASFDDNTIYTIAAMIERMVFLLGGEKSINTDWLLSWRSRRIRDRREYVYLDDEEGGDVFE